VGDDASFLASKGQIVGENSRFLLGVVLGQDSVGDECEDGTTNAFVVDETTQQ